MKSLLFGPSVTMAIAIIIVATAQAADAPLYVYPLMKEVVAPKAQILWDVGNKIMDDDGNADGSKLKPADWTNLAAAAAAMKDASARIAAAPRVAVVAPGMKIEGEGAPGSSSAKQIQAYIDKNPRAFAAQAQALVTVTNGFLDAAKTRDAVKLMTASAKLDEACEACHVKFWYPEQ